jgi:hypothetical protein
MTISKTTDEFLWLENEIALVKTKKYYVVNPPSREDMVAFEKDLKQPLPEDYLRFVERFGKAMLYRRHVGYALSVLVPPKEVLSRHGEGLLLIGYLLGRTVYFRTDQLRGNRTCPVFEGYARRIVLAGPGFAAWLQQTAAMLRSKIGKKQWAAIVAGPPPFSESDREIVAARRLYVWKSIGPQANGDIGIEVTNGSTQALPFLTIGVRSTAGDFNGSVWLRVGDIPSGGTKLVTHDCYKEYLPRESVQLFDLGDPDPEDREHFWEFRQPKNPCRPS